MESLHQVAANLSEKLIQELEKLRDKNPAEALRRVDELDGSPKGKTTAAVILIDCGDAIGDLASISRGVNLMEAVCGDQVSDADEYWNFVPRNASVG